MEKCATCNGKGYVGDTASRHFPKCLDCPTVPLSANCAACGHSRAYHDRQDGRPCRAWDPDRPDHFCACKGWKDKVAPPAPAAKTTTDAGGKGDGESF